MSDSGKKPKMKRKRPVTVNRTQAVIFERQVVIHVDADDVPYLRRIRRSDVDKQRCVTE